MKKRKSIIEIFGDIVLVGLAFLVAFFLRFEFSIPSEYYNLIVTFIGPIVISKVLIFYLTGLYKRIWRYSSIRDFINIIWSCLLGSLVVIVIAFFIYQGSFPRSIVALDGIITVAFIAGSRFIVRGLYELRPSTLFSTSIKPILIIGAGDSGELIVREMLKRPELTYQPVGFIDDNPTKQGLRIHGVKVLGTRHQLKEIIEKNHIEEVIITMPTVSRDVIRDIFEQCHALGVKCKTLPGVYQIIDGTVGVELIRDIDVEDILGREPVRADIQKMSQYISAKTVLVTGAGGSIGSELCRQLCKLNPSRLIMIDQAESSLFQIEQEIITESNFKSSVSIVADITNKSRMKTIFKQYKPSVVFHSAAYKHVPMMESNVIEALENNLFGTQTVAEIASDTGTEKFVLISTDKAVHPINIMGTSKAFAEKMVQTIASHSSTQFMTVRFGNVLDSSGSVVPTFRRQIARGGPVTVTHPDMKRYFMTIPEAIQLIIQAGAIGNGGEIFVLDMGEQVSILELAKNMIKNGKTK